MGLFDGVDLENAKVVDWVADGISGRSVFVDLGGQLRRVDESSIVIYLVLEITRCRSEWIKYDK